MGPVVESIVCSIVASIICEVGKISLSQFRIKEANFEKDSIEEFVLDRLDSKYEILCDSGVFIEFCENPLIYDTINNYIVYEITGRIKELDAIKKNQNINQNNVIDFLSRHLMDKYKENNVLAVPSFLLIKNFFNDLFLISNDYIFEQMKIDETAIVYFINSKMNSWGNGIYFQLEKIVNILEKSIKSEIINQNEKFAGYKEYYTKILKENHKMAHIYLLDKFEIDKFYVPPILSKSNELHKKKNFNFMQEHSINWQSAVYNFNSEELFDDWKYIFECSNIIYVTGGAGYGKSLFMKKIIEEYNKLNLVNANEYMIIYGELKMFYANNFDIPMPVIDFLQNSMKKETLIEDAIISTHLINYYLKRGRCIILLDALDEVEKEKRNNLHKQVINYFKNQNPNNKVCITSRSRGFLPEKDIEVFEIEALSATQIETYVDNIIKLGKFDKEDKNAFLKQTKILVDKGFLSSFLVLSLLINIYKAERELPENKLALYQKCFEYIANKREKEKSQEKYEWKLISILMKDNTFMELSNLCLPNNSDVSKEKVKDELTSIYKAKYVSENETALAIDQFLQFCSDRTELFVPASGEDCFKFFHRSFFEYFYSQYIFTRMQKVEEIYCALTRFDIDSEVFELTLAMYKQKNESKYQEIVSFILSKIINTNSSKEDRLIAINIFILGLQVIDDELYKKKFVDFLMTESDYCVKNIDKICNQGMLVDIIISRNDYNDKLCKKYKSYAILDAFNSFLDIYPQIIEILEHEDKQKNEAIGDSFPLYKFKYFHDDNFYSRIYFETNQVKPIVTILEDIDEIVKDCHLSQKEIKKIKAKINKYLNVSLDKRREIEKTVLVTDDDKSILATKISNSD